MLFHHEERMAARMRASKTEGTAKAEMAPEGHGAREMGQRALAVAGMALFWVTVQADVRSPISALAVTHRQDRDEVDAFHVEFSIAFALVLTLALTVWSIARSGRLPAIQL
jgi:hypothetical protein